MELLKLWPFLLGLAGVLVAIVKVIYQVQKSLDWQRDVAPRFAAMEGVVGKLSGLPDRLAALERGQHQLERKVDRLTPRIREVERLREDLDSLDNDVGGVRDAMMTGRRPPPRTRKARTPPTGVPVFLPEERTDSNDEEG